MVELLKGLSARLHAGATLVAWSSCCLLLILGMTPTGQAADGSAASPTGQQILSRTSEAWQAVQFPPYESFTLPCRELLQHGAQGSCGNSTSMRVSMRMGDGVAHVETVPDREGVKPVVLLPSGHIFGPAFAPLGFTRRLGPPLRVGSLVSSPIGDLKTIGTVTATGSAYAIVVSSSTCNGIPAWHLTLTPRRDDLKYPLRDLVVSQGSYTICELTYSIHFQDAFATVTYAFEQRGNPAVPVIVRITSRVPHRGLFGVGYSDGVEELRDYAFPSQVSGL